MMRFSSNGPSPSGRGRREAPGEGRKSIQILRPSPCPLPEGEGGSSAIPIGSQFLRATPPRRGGEFCFYLFAILIGTVCSASAQVQEPPSLQFARPQGPGAPPPVITLQDALERAKQVDAPYQLAIA